MMIGASQNFLRSFMKSHKSFKKSIMHTLGLTKMVASEGLTIIFKYENISSSERNTQHVMYVTQHQVPLLDKCGIFAHFVSYLNVTPSVWAKLPSGTNTMEWKNS